MTLLNYIIKNNINKSEFALAIGLSHVNALYKYLNGTQVPDKARMKRIVELTKGKVKPNDFY